MADKTPFSTGKMRVAPYSTSLNDSYNLFDVQDVVFTAEFQEALIRTCALLNEFPVADVQYDGEVMMGFSTTSFSEEMLQLTTGCGAGVSAGGYTTYTGSLTGAPVAMTAQFITQDPISGKTITITIPRGKSRTMPVNFTRTDFAKSQFTCYSRPGSGDAPWTIAIQN